MLQYGVRLLTLLVICGIPALSRATTPLKDEFLVSAEKNLPLGYGFDLFQGIRKQAICLTNASSNRLLESAIGTTSTVFRLITRAEELYRATNGSLSAKGSWGLGSAGASAAFSNSFQYESNDTYILGHKYIELGGEDLIFKATDPLGPGQLELTRNALSVLNNKGILEFRKLCGDGYVKSLSKGISIFGRIRIANSSSVEKESFSASISGSYAAMSGGASVSSERIRTLKNKEIDALTTTLGLSPDSMHTTADQFIAAFESFGSSSQVKSPQNLSATIHSYSALSNWPPDAPDLRALPVGIEQIALAESRLRDLEAKYAFIGKRPEGYHFLFHRDAGDYQSNHDRIVNLIDALSWLRNACSGNTETCSRIYAKKSNGGKIQVSQKDLKAISFYLPSISANNFGPILGDGKKLSSKIGGREVLSLVNNLDFRKMALDYFYWNVSLPFEKTGNTNTDQLDRFFALTNNWALRDKLNQKSLSTSEINELKAAMVDFVLNRRFVPLRSSFCADPSQETIMCSVQTSELNPLISPNFSGVNLSHLPPPPRPKKPCYLPLGRPVSECGRYIEP